MNGGFGLELMIFEIGIELQFCVYLFQNGKFMVFDMVCVIVMLFCLGCVLEIFNFKLENDYFKGLVIVEEFYFFVGMIDVQVGNLKQQFKFEQVEGCVQLSDDQFKGNGVEIVMVGLVCICSSFVLFGEVKFNQDCSVFIMFCLVGIVEVVYVNVGDCVCCGQVLVVIFSQVLVDQCLELFVVQKCMVLVCMIYECEKCLFEDKILLEQDYLNVCQVFQEVEIVVEGVCQKFVSLGVGVVGSM